MDSAQGTVKAGSSKPAQTELRIRRMRKRIIILGSTGSIGRNTLSVLAGLDGDWQVVGLAAGARHRDLAAQANQLRPEGIAIAQAEHASALDASLTYCPRVHTGPDALVRLVESVPCDCVVCAMVGAEGLSAVLKAVELGRRVALANKEALVIAGSLLMPLARHTGAEILPIDSEHSAVFQAMQAGRLGEVSKVYLTASGGPFRTWSEEEMAGVTVEDALKHPTWAMGKKVTIDSATMMNKALEIVEARWLFDLRPDQIAVVIHPESIIHSMVEFCDGSLIAQLGAPDMRTPIQYALTYPRRQVCPSPPLDLFEVGALHLQRPDPQRFPALALGYEVAQRGGTCGSVLNAANEAAVEMFREGAISYRDIARYTERALNNHPFNEAPTLDDLLAADRWARREVARCTTS